MVTYEQLAAIEDEFEDIDTQISMFEASKAKLKSISLTASSSQAAIRPLQARLREARKGHLRDPSLLGHRARDLSS